MDESLPLPSKLRYVARCGRGVFWTITDRECYDEIIEKLGVTADEIDDLQSPAIQERGDVLVVNAISLANDKPIEEFYSIHDERYKVRHRVLSEGGDPDAKRQGYNQAVAEAFPDFNKAMPNMAKQRRIFDEYGLKWNGKKRMAECTPGGGRSMDLLTESAVALYGEWYKPKPDLDKLPRDLVIRISRALGWFFQPEVFDPRRFGQRIRNHI